MPKQSNNTGDELPDGANLVKLNDSKCGDYVIHDGRLMQVQRTGIDLEENRWSYRLVDARGWTHDVLGEEIDWLTQPGTSES